MSVSGSVYSGDYEALKKAKGQSRLLLIALVASLLLFATFVWNTSGNAEEFSVMKVKTVRPFFLYAAIANREVVWEGGRRIERLFCGWHRLLLSKHLQRPRSHLRDP
jgi:hypothetical protein